MVKTCHYIYILLFALLLASCSSEDWVMPQTDGGTEVSMDNGKEVKLRIEASFPGMDKVSTRTMTEGSDMTDAYRQSLNLWLLVFGDGGLFVEARKAVNQGTAADSEHGDNVTTFDVTLSKSKIRRIIHFVAGMTDDEVATLTGGTLNTEGEARIVDAPISTEVSLMTKAMVSGQQDAYWCRLEADSVTQHVSWKRVPLVRNYAKIHVEKDAGLADNTFRYEGFYICHLPEKGTVAAYNLNKGEFMDFKKSDTATNPRVAKNYEELDAENYRGFAQGVTYTHTDSTAIDVSTDFTTDDQYLYETPNSEGSAKGRTYMIVKGQYNNGSSTYYKVDIVKKGDYGTEFYNILRNINYRLDINNVTAEGYSSPAEAARHAASNNLSTSVVTEEVNNIGDGNQRLFVSSTYFCFTQQTDDYVELKFKYMGLTTSGGSTVGSYTYSTTEAPTGFQAWTSKLISLHTTGDAGDIFSSDPEIEYGSNADDWCTVRLHIKSPSSEPKTATLRLYVDQTKVADAGYYMSATDQTLYNGEILSRDIQLVLRNPYQMYLDCPASVTGGDGSGVTVNLLIPTNINGHLFPLTFLVEPELKSIYPDTDPATTLADALGLSRTTVIAAADTCPSITNNVLAVQTGETIIPGNTGQSFQYQKILTESDYNKYKARKTVNGTSYVVVPLYFKTNTSTSQTWVYAQSTYFTDAKDQFSNQSPIFDEDYDSKVVTTDTLGKGFDVKIYFSMLSAETLTVKVYEGSTESTYTYPATAGENIYTYKTQTFSDRQIRVELTGDGGHQILVPNSDNKERKFLKIPAGTFTPSFYSGDDPIAWANISPSIYLMAADNTDDIWYTEEGGVKTRHIPADWYLASWQNLYESGTGSLHVINQDIARHEGTQNLGMTITPTTKIRLVGYQQHGNWVSDPVTAETITNAYAAGGNALHNIPLVFRDYSDNIKTSTP